MSLEQYRPSRFQVLPPVVKNLLILNGLFFLATFVFKEKFDYDLTEKLGLFYFTSDYFHPYQFVSYMFMHGSLEHVFFNMFALWMFGNVLENVWGSKRFLIYYMVTGLGAAFIHMVFNAYEFYSIDQAIQAFSNSPKPELFQEVISTHFSVFLNAPEINSFIKHWIAFPQAEDYYKQSIDLFNELIEMKRNIPTVGASGSVFGVLLAFGMLFPNSILYIYFAIPVKAKYFVMAYGAIELFSGIANNPGDNVAHFAHLGGMLFGFLLIRKWRKQDRANFF